MGLKVNPLVVKLGKPVEFEGKKIEEVNLSGLEKLSAKDLIEAEKQYSAEGNYSPQYETTVAYARIIAEKVTDLPLEFFDSLKGKELMKIRNTVTNFFYLED